MSLNSIIQNFLDPSWLYALLLLIPFILLYLFKPKPKHKVIPTLMFLFKDQSKKRQSSFLRRFVQDLLFFLQIIILLAMILAIAKPFINVTKDSLFINSVIVIDVSASMKADFQGETRFDEAIKIAKEKLGKTNTLIIAKKTPEVVFEDETASKIKAYLNGLEATDTPTNLYDAITAAGGYAKEASRIVVLSDFIDTETNTDLNTAKKTLEAQGIKVDYIKISEPTPNIGIVDLKITEAKTSAVIKNFNEDSADVTVTVNSLKEGITIPANSQEIFTFTTPPGTSKIEIASGSDKFEADNEAFISSFGETNRKVLFITNNKNYKKTYLYNVFDVMKRTDLDVTIPPKIPELSYYDLYIFKDVDSKLILPGTFKGVRKEVAKGKAAIIAAQTNTQAINYYELVPFSTNEMIMAPTNILAGSNSFTENIDFGITKAYFKTEMFEGKEALSLASTDDKNSLIAIHNIGEGKSFYYGLLDEYTEAETTFGKSPSYFVFWKRIADFATNTPSLNNLNYHTGSKLGFKEEQTIKTPNGRITGKSLDLDNTGLYTLDDRIIAINLLNEKESNINNDQLASQKGITQTNDRFTEKTPFEISNHLIILALIFLFVEFIYIKLRGDL